MTLSEAVPAGFLCADHTEEQPRHTVDAPAGLTDQVTAILGVDGRA